MELGAPGAVVDEVRSASVESGTAPEISVVVPTYNRSALLSDVIGALETQTLSLDRFEVVIVDDASPDDTWDVLCAMARDSALRLVALRLGTNGGQGPARNQAVAVSRGCVVAFTDDDCIPDAQWLERLTAPLLVDAVPPLVVQGRVEPWEPDWAVGGVWARTVWVLRPTWLFETCNIAYRRIDLQGAGGFPGRDEAPSAPDGKLVGEDAILGWRVLDLGTELVFEPDALVRHRQFPATYWQWLAEIRGRGVFPGLVRRSPQARRALWMRWFLAPRTAAFDAAVAGVLLCILSGRLRWLVSVAPWVGLAWPEARSRVGRPVPVRLAQLAVGDLVGGHALVVSSIRNRCLVL
ncbi:MAG: glycosyltransferase family 2 protein [Acidimicrobiales bacterium]